MKIPKRLDFTRSCFYELPDDTSLIDLNGYELLFRAQYADMFTVRIGPRFYFQFSGTKVKDDFLNSLEASARKNGLIIERQTIYR